MKTELFLVIILVLILLYFLPERKHTIKIRFERGQKSCDESNELTNSTNQIDQEYANELVEAEKRKKNYKTKLDSENQISIEVINDYLSETKCEEGFNTMGPDMNMGNDMDFSAQVILPKTNLNKALSKSLVPDFEPSALNINADLNSYGYATNNQSDNNFYMDRGYLEPTNASQYANSVQYNLEHPYQTRYCKN
jgi:hypothetical protein